MVSVLGIVYLVPFHPIDDVVDVHKPGLGKCVDRSGTTAPGPAHDQERVSGLTLTLRFGDEIGIGLPGKFFDLSVVINRGASFWLRRTLRRSAHLICADQTVSAARR